jgi:hypothetical protein
MLGRVHQQFADELQQGARRDTIFMVTAKMQRESRDPLASVVSIGTR